jgi:hypothetical protein
VCWVAICGGRQGCVANKLREHRCWRFLHSAGVVPVCRTWHNAEPTLCTRADKYAELTHGQLTAGTCSTAGMSELPDPAPGGFCSTALARPPWLCR